MRNTDPRRQENAGIQKIPGKEDVGHRDVFERARERYQEYRQAFLAAGAREFSGDQIPQEVKELGTYIVRRENPPTVLEMIKKRNPLTVKPVDPKTNTRYSNCAVWNPPSAGGLDNALYEGMTSVDNIVTTIGFLPLPDADIAQLPDASPEFFGLDRRNVRSFSGEVPFEELRFVRMRAPIEAISEDDMTEEEKERLDEAVEARMKGSPKAQQYYRWFVFPRNVQ